MLTGKQNVIGLILCRVSEHKQKPAAAALTSVSRDVDGQKSRNRSFDAEAERYGRRGKVVPISEL